MGFLLTLVGITVLAIVAQSVLRFRERRVIRRLADDWQMRYAGNDPFRLAGRVAQQLREPGAADVEIVDLIYSTEGDSYHYILTAEYTTGIIRSKKRRRQVCSLREAKSRDGAFTPLMLAPQELSVIEQYRFFDPHRLPALNPSPSPE